ncbi:MAG: radical SAM protein [Clostridiales bacterium]|nr:radical SAM protein [Clostridiales bacterium]
MHYFVETQACPRRLDEVQKIEEELVKNNITKAETMNQAEIIIYYTCSVTQTAVDRAMSRIEDILENHPDKKVVVCGCLPAMELEKLRKIYSGPICTPTNFSALSDIIHSTICREDMQQVNGIYDQKQQQMNIIIVKGCIRRCSYCAIYKSVGPLMSKPIEKIVSFIQECCEKGIKKFNFQGDSVGDYGVDLQTNLRQLLMRINSIPSDFQIFIEDLHPVIFLKYYDCFEKLILAGRCKQLMIPIQSGSAAVLSKMNRPIDVEELRKKLLSVKKLGIRVDTDIIVGFPGETEKDFDETVRMLKDVQFDNITINLFSDRPNTEASLMEGKVSPKIMLKRCMKLSEQGIRFDKDMLDYQLGHEFRLRKELRKYQDM